MLEQILTPQAKAVITMFCITIAIGTLFWLPMTRFKPQDKLLNFYWAGFWAFMGALVALSGAQATLMLAGQDVEAFGGAMTGALTITFIIFVMFAWARLVLYGAMKAKSKLTAKTA